jgi:hypothetical protein
MSPFVRFVLRLLTAELVPLGAPPAPAPPPREDDTPRAGIAVATLLAVLSLVWLAYHTLPAMRVAAGVDRAPAVRAVHARCNGVRELEAGVGMAGGLACASGRLKLDAGELWTGSPPPVRLVVEVDGRPAAELSLAREAATPARVAQVTRDENDPLGFVRAAAEQTGVKLTIESFRGTQVPLLDPDDAIPVWEVRMRLAGEARLDALRALLARIDAGPWLIHIETLDAEVGAAGGAFTIACTLVSGS